MDFKNVFIGIISGATEVIALQPFLYCKNASQQKLPLTVNPRILYRGVNASIINMSILTGFQYPMYKYFLGYFDNDLLASSLSGAFSGFICTPMELIIIQQQRFGKSIYQVPGNIIKKYGTDRLLRGLTMSSCRESIFTAGYLGMPDLFKNFFEKELNFNKKLANISAPIISGIIASTLSHPFDTVKTCMQGDIPKKFYGNLTETCLKLYRYGGIQRFYSGWLWRTGRMILAVSLLNCCKNNLDYYLS